MADTHKGNPWANTIAEIIRGNMNALLDANVEYRYVNKFMDEAGALITDTITVGEFCRALAPHMKDAMDMSTNY